MRDDGGSLKALVRLRSVCGMGALVCSLVAAAPAMAQTLPCASPTGDCVINPDNLAVGTYNIRPRNLVIKNKMINVTGSGELKILAANITLQPGARVIAPGVGGNTTTVTLDASGTLDIQTAGTSKSKIDVSNAFNGGTINLNAGGNITDNGTLIANFLTDTYGAGGEINIVSQTGNISILGDANDGLKAIGNNQGAGGSIFINAVTGSISIATQLVVRGTDGFVDLEAGTNITATAAGVVDMNALGAGGAGGELDAFAGGDINLAGNILANGSADDIEGGDGG